MNDVIQSMRPNEEFRRGPVVIAMMGGSKDLTVVEVGSFTGESAELFLKTGLVSKIYCIDPWAGGYDDAHDWASRSDMRSVEAEFDMRVGGDRRVVKCKGTLSTVELPKRADIVYIDAVHTYEGVMSDIGLSISQLHPRILSGHDYGTQDYPGVTQAVREALGFPDAVLCDTSWVKFMM
jgi:hypothetical protein